MTLPNRKQNRWDGFDYSSNHWYFITLCTNKKLCFFGENKNLNEFGRIAESEILKIENHFSNVKINKYVIMPNHIHAIIAIGEHKENEKPTNLSTVIGLYKSGTSKLFHEKGFFGPIWQKSFHDHVIRNQQDYNEICRYIYNNPMNWEYDPIRNKQ